jgi:hypothetical protein
MLPWSLGQARTPRVKYLDWGYALRCRNESAALANGAIEGALSLTAKGSKAIAEPLRPVAGAPMGLKLMFPDVAVPEDSAAPGPPV